MLPSFNEQATCPKCGHNAVTTTYCAPLPFGKGTTLCLCCYELAEEHLHRQCARCKFGWPEACLDAAQKGA